MSRHEEREVVDCFVPHVSDLLDIANHSEKVVFRRHWQLTCLFLDKVRCRDNYFLPAGDLSADSRGALPDVAQQHTPVFFCTAADLAVCHSTDSHQEWNLALGHLNLCLGLAERWWLSVSTFASSRRRAHASRCSVRLQTLTSRRTTGSDGTDHVSPPADPLRMAMLTFSGRTVVCPTPLLSIEVVSVRVNGG